MRAALGRQLRRPERGGQRGRRAGLAAPHWAAHLGCPLLLLLASCCCTLLLLTWLLTNAARSCCLLACCCACLQRLAFEFAALGVLALASQQVSKEGTLSLGGYVSLTYYVRRALFASEMLTWQARSFNRHVRSIAVLTSLMQEQPAVRDARQAKRLVLSQPAAGAEVSSGARMAAAVAGSAAGG